MLGRKRGESCKNTLLRKDLKGLLGLCRSFLEGSSCGFSKDERFLEGPVVGVLRARALESLGMELFGGLVQAAS